MTLQKLKLIDLIDEVEKKSFYRDNIFHERQMNSCPIGCEGCAVSAVTSAKGAISYGELYDFYKEANSLGVSLKITKVEGYDPVFVQYEDSKLIPFAASVQACVDFGHQIITPVCTTGSWKAERTKWQIKELGKLTNKYRSFTYPSGNFGEHFVLSVPREINMFKNAKYDFNEHVTKIVEDINLLTVGGNLQVLVYFNSKVAGDFEVAADIKKAVEQELSKIQKERADILVTDFNCETLPESCFRYKNSVLICDKGFAPINQDSLDWGADLNLISQQELIKRMAVV